MKSTNKPAESPLELPEGVTLPQYRKEWLRIRQAAIAETLRCPQGSVSKVENGHLPRPWERQRWADAYKLTIELFETLVRAALAARVRLKPMKDTEPLMAAAAVTGVIAAKPTVEVRTA